MNLYKDVCRDLGLQSEINWVWDDGGRSKVGYKFKSKRTDDCAVRSIVIALGLPYEQVFRELMYLGMEYGAYPNWPCVFERYLKDQGWIKNKCPRDGLGKLIKLRDWHTAPSRAVVTNSGHLTAIVNGECRDLWDCTYRPVNSYWTKA